MTAPSTTYRRVPVQRMRGARRPVKLRLEPRDRTHRHSFRDDGTRTAPHGDPLCGPRR